MNNIGTFIWIFAFICLGGILLIVGAALLISWYKKTGRIMFKNMVRTIMIFASLIPSVYRALSKGSYIVDVVFKTYVYFYKKNLRDISNWGFSDDFPKGKTDLYKMFVWITRTRGKNYKLLKQMEKAYHAKSSKVYIDKEYWDGIDFKIKDGALSILPFNDTSELKPDRRELLFKREITRMYYDLHMLDSDMCGWIISRRRYFGI